MPMNDVLGELFIPLILSNLIHMWVVKRNHLANLNIPVAEQVFGRNKNLSWLYRFSLN